MMRRSITILTFVACSCATTSEQADGTSLFPSVPSDDGSLPEKCHESTTAVALDDKSVGFTGAELLAASVSPFASVAWRFSTADVASEAMTLTCSPTPLAAEIVTRTVVGELDPGDACAPGPELRVATTCTLSLGGGSITGEGKASFQASSLDHIGMAFVDEDLSITSERRSGLEHGAELGRLNGLVFGFLPQATVEIDVYWESATGDGGVSKGWLGEASP